MPSRAVRNSLVCMMVAALSLSGCSSKIVSFVDEGREFELQSTAEVLATVNAPRFSEEKSVSESRTEALTQLRDQGEQANQAADLITRTFPSDTRSVPFYVERATVDGKPAWLVIEAIGKAGAPLEDERLWVLDDEGSVLFSAME